MRRAALPAAAALLLAGCALILRPAARAATFNLETAGIPEIHAAVDAGALSYEKLVSLYLARIKAYDQQGPALNTVIALNPKALETAREALRDFDVEGIATTLDFCSAVVADRDFITSDIHTRWVENTFLPRMRS